MYQSIFALVISAFALSGCVTAKETYTADGKVGHSIDCTTGKWGGTGTWGECYEKAGATCGAKGYTVLDKSADQTASAGGSFFGVFGRTINSRSLVVQCKE
jgi:hypothetical protein